MFSSIDIFAGSGRARERNGPPSTLAGGDANRVSGMGEANFCRARTTASASATGV